MEGEVPQPQPEAPEKAQEQEAREMLSPEQRVMSEARVAILGPLDRVELSEAEKETVGKYAGKVGELAGQELERLRRESPVRRIAAAMEERLPFDPDKPGEKVEGMRSIAEMPKKWQAAVREEQGLALLQGKPTSRPEIIERISNAPQLYGGSEKFPTYATVFVAERSEEKDALNQFLNRLNVLPEGTSVDLLFKLPETDWAFSRNPTDINRAIQEGKPTRLSHGNTVVGLKSDQLPGVDFQVGRYMDRFTAQAHFTPEAIARATTDIPGVEQ